MKYLKLKPLINAAVFLGVVTLSPSLSYSADAYGTLCSSYSTGTGDAGFPCVVADPEFGYGPPGGDNENSVELVLSYMYDTPMDVDMYSEVPSSGDFNVGTYGDFTFTGVEDDGEYTNVTWTYTGAANLAPEFATVKSGSSAYAIFNIAGLTTGQIFTTNLIMNSNNNNAKGISHIRFWDSGDTPPQVSEPAALGLMGLALSGLYVLNRRRRNA